MRTTAKLKNTIGETEVWIDEFVQQLQWHDRNIAYDALIAALHALRDSLAWDASVQLGAYFPPLLRGLYYEGWHPTARPLPMADNRNFLDRIHDAVHREPGIDPELVARAMFSLLARRLPAAELEDARAATPRALHAFWPA